MAENNHSPVKFIWGLYKFACSNIISYRFSPCQITPWRGENRLAEGRRHAGSCPYVTPRKIIVFYVCKYAARALSELSAVVFLTFDSTFALRAATQRYKCTTGEENTSCRQMRSICP